MKLLKCEREGRTLIVAEVGNAHDGSLSEAAKYIWSVAEAGADAIKYQCHLGDPCNTFRDPSHFPKDATRQDYWRRIDFDFCEWECLQRCANNRNLEFLCTPFSPAALQMIEPLVPAIKIGSGQTSDLELIDAACSYDKPIILSTGMSSPAEVEAAVEVVRRHELPLAVLHSTSLYPCPLEKVSPYEIRMPVLGTMFAFAKGLSDHSGTIWPSLYAAALGADVIEVHVCFSRDCFGPDVSSSLTIPEFAQMVQGIRAIETMRKHSPDKDELANLPEIVEMRGIFR